MIFGKKPTNNPKPRPLSKAEINWLDRLEKLLMNPPTKRIGFYTTGGPYLNAYDNRFEDHVHYRLDNDLSSDFCGATDELDVDLMSVKSAVNIHSTAG